MRLGTDSWSADEKIMLIQHAENFIKYIATAVANYLPIS